MNNEKVFKVNLVVSCVTRELFPIDVTWNELKDHLGKLWRNGHLTLENYLAADTETRKKEKDGKAWIPCSVHDQGGARVRENMNEAGFVVLDIDCGMTLTDIEEILSSYEFVVHSSYSYTPEKPKWRVVLPLMETIPANKLPIVFDHFNELFSGRLDVSCGHDPARLYYLPACPADATHLFRFVEHSGSWVDGYTICDMWRSKPTATEISTGRHNSSVEPQPGGVPVGSRNNELTRQVGRRIAEGMGLEEIIVQSRVWNEWNSEPLPDKEVVATVKSVFKTHTRRSAATATNLDAVINLMNEKFVWNERHARIFRFQYMDHISPEALKNIFANTEIECEVKGQKKVVTYAEAWLRSPQRARCCDVTFSPGEPQITADNCINLWRGWAVQPADGNIAPWRDMLNHLFAGNDDHRRWFEQWLAYPFQHPGCKLSSAVVLWSARQGVGKSLIGETVGRLYGPHFRVISAAELHGAYNGWAKDAQFVLGEENASNDHRADANKLKHLITGGTVVVNEKYQPSIELPNRMNFLFTSNHPDAFHLEKFDRRFFIWEIKGASLPDKFFQDFVDWLNKRGGLAALMYHFMTLDLVGFDPKGHAPLTDAKLEMISHSRTEVERWLNDTLDGNVVSLFGKEVATYEELVDRYHGESRGRTNTTAMAKALRRISAPAQRRVKTRRGRKQLISLTNHELWAANDSEMWAREFEKPRGVRTGT